MSMSKISIYLVDSDGVEKVQFLNNAEGITISEDGIKVFHAKGSFKYNLTKDGQPYKLSKMDIASIGNTLDFAMTSSNVKMVQIIVFVEKITESTYNNVGLRVSSLTENERGDGPIEMKRVGILKSFKIEGGE